MEYQTRNESNVTILDLSGEIDVSQAPHLRDTLIKLIENNSEPLLINLGNVRYIDSSGLSVLIAAHRKAQNSGGTLSLSNLQQSVQQVFKLTRTDKVFQIFSSVDEGVAALSNS